MYRELSPETGEFFDMMVREERFDHEFMWGDSLLIVPITEESSDVYFYLPKENGLSYTVKANVSK